MIQSKLQEFKTSISERFHFMEETRRCLWGGVTPPPPSLPVPPRASAASAEAPVTPRVSPH